MLITELFEPKSLGELDPKLNVKVVRSDDRMWTWQFEVPDYKEDPTPFCLRAADLHKSYYMSEQLEKCWFVNMIQAECSFPIGADPETLIRMGSLGNMGRESVTVFSTAGSLLNDFAAQTQAKGMVFNSVVGREKLYTTFAAVIKRKTGWIYASATGSFPMPQIFYFFAKDKKVLSTMMKNFRDIGQID